MQIKEISINDKEYPKRLRYIKNPPEILYVLGNTKILNDEGIAIIGSRCCTEGGRRNARVFAANIANAGLTVISGLAKGIDVSAHIGALEVKGKTIAVLGNGPKYVFPPENADTYKNIIESGGAIVSEYPEDTEPSSDRFRQRNRIVSGLSEGVLIVEAEWRSGTSITARYAREQGKEVFCIANSRENRKGIGTNIQIQKGATLVMEPKEVIQKYKANRIEQLTIEDLEIMQDKQENKLETVKEEYRAIYKALAEEISLNEISVKTKMEISELYEKLFLMEMEGLIEVNQNKYKIKER